MIDNNHPHDIFISYSRKNKDIVLPIKDEIERLGLTCWIDLSDIPCGAENFKKKVISGIKQTRIAFLFFLSAESQSSEYAMKEINFAKKVANKCVILVRFNDDKMTDEFAFDYQDADVIDWRVQEQKEKLLHQVKVLSEQVRRTDETVRMPSDQWDLICDSLARHAHGQICMKLAHVTSFFSPEGSQKHILRYLWGKLVAPDADTDLEFNQAIDVLRRYEIISGSGLELRIQRFAITAIRRFAMDAGADLEDAIGKSLALYKGMKPEDWLSLTGNERILRYIPRMFLFTRDDFNVSLQTKVLSKSLGFQNECHWDCFNKNDWVVLLTEYPQFVSRCPLAELDGYNWATLLGAQPQFADRCPFEKLAGYDWATLLGTQPQFSDRCPWEELDGESWATLLGTQPQFSDRCPWEELDGESWATLLEVQPRFSVRCPFDKLDGYDWAPLLGAQPQFADRCPFEKLDGYDWATLLGAQPQFVDRCPFEKLVGYDWATLLRAQPQFFDRCPWDMLGARDWIVILLKQPQFSDFCPWESFKGMHWLFLLRRMPQFACRCSWDKLDGNNWAYLLCHQPKFADYCQWEKLTENDWVTLLGAQPQFADQMRRNKT